MISAIKVPGFNRNNDNLSPFLAASCSRTDVQRRRNICVLRLLRSMNVFFLLLFVSPRKGTQTGEQQADDDRRGPFSRKYRSLTSANPPHYSQSSLAGRASFRLAIQMTARFFIFMHLFMSRWICSFERGFFFFWKTNACQNAGMQHLSAGGEMTSNQSPAAPSVAAFHLVQAAFASAASSPYMFDHAFTIIPHRFCGLGMKIPVRVATSYQNKDIFFKKIWKKPLSVSFFFFSEET